MTGKPIIFSGEMVRALLEGRKTQARRVIKPPKNYPHDNICRPDMAFYDHQVWFHGEYEAVGVMVDAPYNVDDLLWVRETWRGWVPINAPWQTKDTGVARYTPDPKLCQRVDYRATHDADKEPYRPSSQMPRWASRLTLRVTKVRAERLQDISEDDAQAEGMHYSDGSPDEFGMYRGIAVEAKDEFRHTWEALYPKDSPKAWHRNPWAWVYDFEVIGENIDRVLLGDRTKCADS